MSDPTEDMARRVLREITMDAMKNTAFPIEPDEPETWNEVIFKFSPQPPKITYPLTHTWRVKCDCCWGKGCFTNDGYSEEYCDCEAGKWRRVYDGCEVPA